jgi:hypothetical protein
VASTVALTLLTFLLVAAVAAGGIGVTWWAIFGDKARGRRRCPRCWHDLSGTPGLTCGECGHAARAERDLLAARRRWGIAAATVAFMVAIAGWTRLTVLDARWHTHLPDGALVLAVRALDDGNVPRWAWAELDARASMDTLGADSAIDALEALVRPGEPIAPGSARAMLVDALAATEPEELDDDPLAPPAERAARGQARQAFVERRDGLVGAVPLHVDVRVPRAWTAGAGPVGLASGWLPGPGGQWRVRVEGERTWVAAWSGRPRGTPERVAVLRLPAPGEDGRVRTRVEAQWRRAGPAASGAGADDAPGGAPVGWSPSTWLALDAPVGRADADSPAPVDGDAIRAAVREAFVFPVTAWQDESRPVTFSFDMRPEFPVERPGGRTLVGVVVELLERGVVRRSVAFWWHGTGGRRGSEVLHEDLDALRRLRALGATDEPRPIDGWTLRVRGDLATALLAAGFEAPPGEQDTYWAGTLEEPASVRVEASPAPARPVWRITEPAE